MEYFSEIVHTQKREFKKILTILTHESRNARLQGLCALFAIVTYSPRNSPTCSPQTSPSCHFTSGAYHSPEPANSHVGDWFGEYPGEYVGEYLISQIPLSIGLSALSGEYGEWFCKFATKIVSNPFLASFKNNAYLCANNYLCSHKSELAGMATKQATSPLIQQKSWYNEKKSSFSVAFSVFWCIIE